jgi:hypothetical protein
MAAVRYTWMFRTAAVVYLALGGSWLWTASFTAFRPDYRPYLLALAAVAIAIGIFLFRRHKTAIACSALGAAFVSICAAVAAPQMRGPGILVLAALAIVCGLYAALAGREIFGGRS